MSTLSSLPRIGLNDLIEAEKGAIWLVNTSSEKFQSGAEVYITIVNGDQSSVFVMPRTWLPVEITGRFPRKNIVASSYFISALANGLVAAVPESYAKSLLSSPKAERERARLESIESAIREAGAARGIGKNVSISTGDPERDSEVADQLGKTSENFVAKASSISDVNFAEDEDEEQDKVNANFRAWVIKLNTLTDIAEVENELRMRGNMTLDEAFFLLKNCDHEEIQEKLTKKLRKLGQAV